MIINSSELAQLRQDTADQTLALRFGCYDILHIGHQAGIDFAKAQADLLVVGVMPDEYVRAHKGNDRPVNPEAKRAAAIDEAEGVDFSFIAEPGALAIAGLFMHLRPDVYVEDAEYGRSKLKAAFLKSIGVKYLIDENAHLGSSSRMIADMGVNDALTNSSLSYRPV